MPFTYFTTTEAREYMMKRGVSGNPEVLKFLRRLSKAVEKVENGATQAKVSQQKAGDPNRHTYIITKG